MDKIWFTSGYGAFFRELAANNHKEWFDANRKRYAQEVKAPFEAFLQHLIQEIQMRFEPDLLIGPKEAMFRINRDIRFSKDKRPYKTNLSALLSPRGRKDTTFPALYLELGAEGCQIFGGCYMPDKDALFALRNHLANHRSEFEGLVGAPAFQTWFGSIKGEQNQRLPAEFKEANWDLLRNKQFYYQTAMKPGAETSQAFSAQLMEAYEAQFEVMQFLREPFEE